jgi:hypothetical protein
LFSSCSYYYITTSFAVDEFHYFYHATFCLEEGRVAMGTEASIENHWQKINTNPDVVGKFGGIFYNDDYCCRNDKRISG